MLRLRHAGSEGLGQGQSEQISLRLHATAAGPRRILVIYGTAQFHSQLAPAVTQFDPGGVPLQLVVAWGAAVGFQLPGIKTGQRNFQPAVQAMGQCPLHQPAVPWSDMRIILLALDLVTGQGRDRPATLLVEMPGTTQRQHGGVVTAPDGGGITGVVLGSVEPDAGGEYR